MELLYESYLIVNVHVHLLTTFKDMYFYQYLNYLYIQNRIQLLFEL